MVKAAAIKVGEKIYTGIRHASIMRDVWEEEQETYISLDMQGFVDENGNFLTRQEAAKIAFECGQINRQVNELDSYMIF